MVTSGSESYPPPEVVISILATDPVRVAAAVAGLEGLTPSTGWIVTVGGEVYPDPASSILKALIDP